MNELVQEYVHQILQPNARWFLGMSWTGVPVNHDIHRSDYWIYTEDYEATHRVKGAYLKFEKVKKTKRL